MTFKLASATYVQYVHATGDGFDGQATEDTGDEWEFAWSAAGPEDDCSEFDNRYWRDVSIYVGNSTTIDGNTPCGLASKEGFISNTDLVYDGSSEVNEATLMDIIMVGASVKCPETIGTSQYVIFYYAGDTSAAGGARRPCNIGIFSCECSNYAAVDRSEPIDGSSLDFVVLGQDYTIEALESVDPDTLVLSQSKSWAFPEITAYTECGSCSTRVIAQYDESLEPYLDV